MKKFNVAKNILLLLISITLFGACSKKAEFKISKENITPGTIVFAGETKINLYDGHIKVGDNFNDILEETLGNRPIKKISIINIVPSIDTPVCEQQTHVLGESEELNEFDKFTISRDLPMAQKRFAKEAKLENITYLSDYKYGAFGKKTGLLMKGKELLARAVIVTDETGIIRYLQIVENVYFMPNMQAAFESAKSIK
jgi:thiol peroxidase